MKSRNRFDIVWWKKNNDFGINGRFTPQNSGPIFESLKDDFYGFDAILCWPHICRIAMDENVNFNPKSENSKNAPKHIFSLFRILSNFQGITKVS